MLYEFNGGAGGHVVFYTVQWWWTRNAGGQWAPVPDNALARLRGRASDAVLAGYGPMGSVWQQIRQHGFWQREPAETLAALLRESRNEGDLYRVVQIEANIKVTPTEPEHAACPLCRWEAGIVTLPPTGHYAVRCRNGHCGLQGPVRQTVPLASEAWGKLASMVQAGDKMLT